MPTVAQMIAVSNRTGCVSLGSKTLQASLKDMGLPTVISRVYARINSVITTAQIGRFLPSIWLCEKISVKPDSAKFKGIKTVKNHDDLISEIEYAKDYPNSFLDIIYPDENREADRPTLFYFHGGGFFAGSKNMGDPLAQMKSRVFIERYAMMQAVSVPDTSGG